MKAIHVFRPEVALAMSHAFDDVCAFLQVPSTAVKARELIAKRIIELGRQGEHEYEHLRGRVLHEADYRLGLHAQEGAIAKGRGRQRARRAVRAACGANRFYPERPSRAERPRLPNFMIALK